MNSPVAVTEIDSESDTPKEVVTLKVEDVPIIVEGEGYICTTCYEIIPEAKYVSHRRRKGCHSPARPLGDRQDNLNRVAMALRIELNCNTCHREFASERAKDRHEPCRGHTPTGSSAKRRPRRPLSKMAADIKRRGERISAKAANKIMAYRAILRKPNNKGTYNVNGKVMSTRDIEVRIQRLSCLL